MSSGRFARSLSCCILLAGASGAASAGELVYKPVNPSFGGNPFYSSHLLGVAGAQNKYDDHEKDDLLGGTGADMDFERVIRQSLLSRIASQIANQIYGENALDQGQFVIGSTTVKFFRQGGQTIVDIIDGATGGQTRIEMPTPGF